MTRFAQGYEQRAGIGAGPPGELPDGRGRGPRRHLVGEDGSHGPQPGAEPPGVAFMGELDEAFYRLRVQHVGKAAPVLVAGDRDEHRRGHVVLAGRQDRLQHRLRRAREVPAVVVGPKPPVVAGLAAQHHPYVRGEVNGRVPADAVMPPGECEAGHHPAGGQPGPVPAPRGVPADVPETAAGQSRVALHHPAADGTAGIGVLVVEMDGQAELPGLVNRHLHQVEEGVAEVRLGKALAGVQVNAADALRGHRRELAADSPGGDPGVPEPERVKPWRHRPRPRRARSGGHALAGAGGSPGTDPLTGSPA